MTNPTLLPMQPTPPRPHDEPMGLITDPFPDPVSERGKQAAKLRAEAERATTSFHEVETESRKARDAYDAAVGALHEAVLKGVRGRRDAKAEASAVAAVQKARAEADPGILRIRENEALRLQRAAVFAWRGFVGAHVEELHDEEIAPEAEAAAEEWARIEADPNDVTMGEHRAAVERYSAVRARTLSLRQVVRDASWLTNERVANQPGAPPVAPREAFGAVTPVARTPEEAFAEHEHRMRNGLVPAAG